MSGKTNERDCPPVLNRVLRYSRALARWFKGGRPIRTVEEIRILYTAYCRRCPEFDTNIDRCRVCGCYVNLRESPLSNKIAMGTEHCPLGIW